MSELRKDPIIDRWVIIAAERGRRPDDFAVGEPPDRSMSPASCPFCAGNEAKTPPETWAIRDPDSRPNGTGWRVRVVPNKFPALRVEGDVERRGLGMFDCMDGVGAHEVIIESPRHDWDMAEAPVDEVELVMRAVQERMVDLYRDTRLRYVVAFRNYGAHAGASLGHPHSQLIAVPVMPKRVKDKLASARDHYRRKERCIFCDVIAQELMLGDRVVVDHDHFVALSPYAARFPFELAIYPKQHQHDFGRLDEQLRMELAHILQICLRSLKLALDNPAYNYIINSVPNTAPRPGRPDYWGTVALDYHWHIEILPRITRVAGFEWGTGFYINPVSPEDAAQFLRATIASGAKPEEFKAVDAVGSE